MAFESTDTTDDWEIARKAASGDESAFESLVERFSPVLFKFLASRLGRTDADDALSVVWMKVWRAMNTNYKEQHFRGWVFQIARNVINDQLRKRVTKARVEDELSHSPPDALETNLPDVSNELQQRETDLRDCVGNLNSEYASVVIRLLTGDDHNSIAKFLSIPLGTSHSRLAKAKPLLRQCMERKGWTA